MLNEIFLLAPTILVLLFVFARPLRGVFIVLLLSPLKTLGEDVLLFARLLGMWIVAVTFTRLLTARVKIRWVGIEKPVILMALGMSLSFFRTDNIRKVAMSILSLISLYGLLLIMFTLIQNRKQLERLVIVFLVSGIYPIVRGVMQALQPNSEMTYTRISGTFTLPTGLGAFLIPIILFSFAFAFYPSLSRSKRGIVLIIFGGSMFALFMTLSRGSIYGVALGGIVVYLSLRSQIQKNRVLMSLIVIIGFAIFWKLWPSINGRVIKPILDFIATGNSKDVTQRLNEFSMIIPITIDNKFMGTGIGNYRNSALRYRVLYNAPGLPVSPHNIFLYFWGEVGAVGAIGFFWLLVTIYKYLKSTYQFMMDSCPDIVFYVYIGSVGSLIGYTFFMITHGGFFQNEIWITMAFFFVSIRLAEKKMAQANAVSVSR
jgi:hypothetical protein